MSDDRYTIRMEPEFPALQRVDVPEFAARFEPWFNQTLCRVNDSLVRLGVFAGEFHWHQHDDDDEFFYVVDGRLVIELDGRDSVELAPGQGVTIPRGLRHRPIAPQRTTVLMVESDGIVPTGD